MNPTDKITVLTNLFNGEWVDTDLVQEALGIDFSTGLKLFDFSRTAEWWALCGRTEEERKRNGQCIVTKFKLKPNDSVRIGVALSFAQEIESYLSYYPGCSYKTEEILNLCNDILTNQFGWKEKE